MTLYLRDDLAVAFADRDVFRTLEDIEGDVYRHKEGRKTLRIQMQGKHYFLKLHAGVGWREIVKNLFQMRLPVLGASNEWRAIEHCRAKGIDTLTIAGYGSRGCNPARQRSFLITDALENVLSLEDYCTGWNQKPPPYTVRKKLVTRVAEVCRQFHEAGMNHRDFYLCHFLLGGNPQENPDAAFYAPLYLIDLHRVQIRRRVPRRWLIKDLGALYFSAVNLGFRRRDIVRFLRVYLGKPAKAHLAADKSFWQSVRCRTIGIHRRDYGTDPRLPL